MAKYLKNYRTVQFIAIGFELTKGCRHIISKFTIFHKILI